GAKDENTGAGLCRSRLVVQERLGHYKGTKRIAQKVGEEGVEVALAAMAKDREELINESADLLYHLTVLLQNEGLGLKDVVQRLHERHTK
uniref:phosphoribosyl-ATP diphosphatase n=1 Tax=Aeromonas caviae TaxID=648 RepID=UPI002B496F77